MSILSRKEMKQIKSVADEIMNRNKQVPKVDTRKHYKVWIKKGQEKFFINYYTELQYPGQVFYHLQKNPRITVGNAIYNVLAWDKYWIEEVK